MPIPDLTKAVKIQGSMRTADFNREQASFNKLL